jgi:uncharacterized protein with HEPN domain
MNFDSEKVTKYVASLDLKQLSANEMVAVGNMIKQIGESKKESEYIDEILNRALIEGGGPWGNVH